MGSRNNQCKDSVRPRVQGCGQWSINENHLKKQKNRKNGYNSSYMTQRANIIIGIKKLDTTTKA